MIQALKRILYLGLGMAAVEQASAFTGFGPAETWQVPALDYVTRYYYGDTELGGPKSAILASRLNTGIITYGYDYTFLQFFGAKGVAAIDKAMAELNALPPASQIKINNYPMQGNQVVNYTAQALTVTDLRSTVLSLMMEHMGLNGETHVWDLREDYTETTPTGDTAIPCDNNYIVINDNYDPVTLNPSSYVNGTQYGFQIWNGCPIAVAVADAVEQTADETSPDQWVASAVATRESLRIGGYYLGLTYDDVGGLKYLYNRNRLELEALEANALPSVGSSTFVGLSLTTTNALAGLTNIILGGVEKVQYVKLNWGPYSGTFVPRTFNYTIPWLNNGAMTTLQITRTVTQPDIIFAAGDLAGPPTGTGTFIYSSFPEPYTRSNVFILNGFVGVGGNPLTSQVIAPEETITFNDEIPAYYAGSPSFLTQYQLGTPFLQWGTFDGTTNPPVIFPESSSVAALEEAVESGAYAASSNAVPSFNPLTFITTNTGTTGTGTGTGTATGQ